MSLEAEFKNAADRVQNLPSKPGNDVLLNLYALYKQGSEGDVTGPRPGMMDIKGRAKYDAWAKQKGKGKEESMKEYIDLVTKLEQGG